MQTRRFYFKLYFILAAAADNPIMDCGIDIALMHIVGVKRAPLGTSRIWRVNGLYTLFAVERQYLNTGGDRAYEIIALTGKFPSHGIIIVRDTQVAYEVFLNRIIQLQRYPAVGG